MVSEAVTTCFNILDCFEAVWELAIDAVDDGAGVVVSEINLHLRRYLALGLGQERTEVPRFLPWVVQQLGHRTQVQPSLKYVLIDEFVGG